MRRLPEDKTGQMSGEDEREPLSIGARLVGLALTGLLCLLWWNAVVSVLNAVSIPGVLK